MGRGGDMHMEWDGGGVSADGGEGKCKECLGVGIYG